MDNEQCVPKSDINAPDWARVAIEGWGKWLEFWGLDRPTHPAVLHMVDMGMMASDTETEALDNMSVQAKAQYASVKAQSVLSGIERDLYRLERVFMTSYHTEAFRREYGIYRDHERYRWISEQTGLGRQIVRSTLDEVSYILGAYAIEEYIDEMKTREDQSFRQLVREVLRETG